MSEASGAEGRRARTVDVLVVGAGPAGLTAAAHLAVAGCGTVEVLEREPHAGGAPRHCHHGGFGTPWTTGPRYAARRLHAATDAGAAVRTSVTVTGLPAPRTVDVTGPDGLERITARALVLATGARERPRAARLVPGTRPAGIYTTGELQQAVHLYGQHIGRRAVVVGAEPVAYAALDTLRRAGVTVVAQLTDLDRPQVPPLRAADARLRHAVPLLTRTTVAEVLGRGRLTGVRLLHADGRTVQLPCDTLVFTGDFVPEPELARAAGLCLDRATRGPLVDPGFRTDVPGVFAVGNVLHAVETATTAAAEGRTAAAAVRRLLAHEGEPPADPGPRLLVAPPLRWITPGRLSHAKDATAATRFLVRSSVPLPVRSGAALTVTQDGRTLHTELLKGPLRTGNSFALYGHWLTVAEPEGGPVRLALEGLPGPRR
ncbi:NAD(P)/FAD-dependent oxidoreductase [Streptomyces sp. B-S-A8]|uniref:NAD(P)/FAD-dependent oxidoreductase n=1 Tax=Streptomyces solicavernae TaxID=3043614 RepID=A0ABT6RKK6_9ACTN|nr:NAD(P)/FAD-dependent oxidoreductase [Streptomyces sp. B-S-A8]MDI3384962.1 NAD(P)/FAD-dependent oxidoreductase [Streptomyces sp. B-S-A8]